MCILCAMGASEPGELPGARAFLALASNLPLGPSSLSSCSSASCLMSTLVGDLTAASLSLESLDMVDDKDEDAGLIQSLESSKERLLPVLLSMISPPSMRHVQLRGSPPRPSYATVVESLSRARTPTRRCLVVRSRSGSSPVARYREGPRDIVTREPEPWRSRALSLLRESLRETVLFPLSAARSS